MPLSVNSRIRILSLPVAAPGICCLCGSATKPVIDFGKNLDEFGAVYFCIEDCLREIADAMGYIPVAKFDSCYDDLRELQISNAQLQRKYESVNDALRNVLSDNHISSIVVGDPVSDSIPVVEKSELFDASSDSPISGIAEDESSTSIEGSDDLFDSTDFDHDD